MPWFEQAAGVLRSAATAAVDFILPPQCLLCSARTRESAAVCAQCWVRLTFIEAPLCDRLGLPFAYDPGAGIVSAAALARPPAWSRARAAVRFDETSRKLVHGLKYHDRHELAGLMARLMLRAGRELVADADLIVPVPLHRFRLWRRRYNQSALLAGALAAGIGAKFAPEALRRVRPTHSQVGLGQRERRRNVRGAFAVPEEALALLARRNVVLVDDVMTTGATAEACANALLAAGARRVDVLVFALVADPVRLHI